MSEHNKPGLAYRTSLKDNTDFLARDLLDKYKSKQIKEKVGQAAEIDHGPRQPKYFKAFRS